MYEEKSVRCDATKDESFLEDTISREFARTIHETRRKNTNLDVHAWDGERIFEIETKKCIKIVGANYRNIEIEFSRATNFEWRKFDPRFDRLEAGRKRAVRILA